MVGIPDAPGFPAPTQGLFPESSLTPFPLFGLNPYQPGSGFHQAAQPSLPSATSQYQLATMQSLGIDTSSIDPATGNPTSAAGAGSAIQGALAKLSTINPQLADTLAQQYGQQGGFTTQGGGLLHGLMHIAGEILAPGLSLGGKVLNLIGRTAHVIPSIVQDIADHNGKFNPFTDVGNALTGKDQTNWNKVFQTMGWTGGGGFGVLRAIMGGGMDMLTDPITYAMAPLGINAAEKGMYAAREVAVKQGTESIAQKMALTSGRTAAEHMGEAEQVIRNSFKVYSGQLEGYAKAAGNATIDRSDLINRAGSMFSDEVSNLYKQELSHAWEAGSQAYLAVQDRTFGQMLRRGGELTLSDGTKVPLSEVRATMEEQARAGNWKNRVGDGREAWQHAKEAAAAIGGVRTRFIVPFTRFRYLGPQMLPAALGGLSTGVIGRFASGLAGDGVLWKALDSQKANMADIVKYHTEGFSGLLKAAEENPAGHAGDVLNLLRGRRGGLASGYYTTSEYAGRLTAKLTKGAALYRGGLAGAFIADSEKLARSSADNIRRNLLFGTLEDAEGKAKEENLARIHEEALGLSARASHNTATAEDMKDHALFSDFFNGKTDIPIDQASVDNGSFKGWWENTDRYKTARAAGDEQAMANLDRLYEEQTRLLSKFADGSRERAALLSTGAAQTTGRESVERVGIDMGDVNAGRNATVTISRSDVTGHQLGVIPELRAYTEEGGKQSGQHWYAEVPPGVEPEAYLRDVNLQEGANVRDFQGVHVTNTPDMSSGGRWVEVSVDTKNPLIAHGGGFSGEELGAVMHDTDFVDGLRAQIDQAQTEIQRQAEAATSVMRTPVATLANAKATNKELLWDAVDRARPSAQAADGLLEIHPGGEMHLAVRDSKGLRVISDTAEHAPSQGGYLPRYISRDFKNWLGLIGRQDDHDIFGPGGIVAGLASRRTRNLSLQEAEDLLRERLTGGKFTGDIFEKDVRQVHSMYANRLAGAMKSHMMGETLDHMRSLSDLVPGHFGWAVDSANDRPVIGIPDGAGRMLQRASDKTQNAVTQLAYAMNKSFDQTGEASGRAFNALSALLADAREGLGANSDQGFSKEVQALLQARDARDKAVAAELVSLDAQEARHTAHLDRTAQAIENLSAGTAEPMQVNASDLTPMLEFPHRAVISPEGTMTGRTLEQVEALRQSLRERGFAADEPAIPGSPEPRGPIRLEYDPETNKGIIRERHHGLGVAADEGLHVPVEVKRVSGLEGGAELPNDLRMRVMLRLNRASSPSADIEREQLKSLIREKRVTVDTKTGEAFISSLPGKTLPGRYLVRSEDQSLATLDAIQARKSSLAAEAADFSKAHAAGETARGARRTSAEVLLDKAHTVRTKLFDSTGKSAAEVARLQANAQRVVQRVATVTQTAQAELNRVALELKDQAERLSPAILTDAKLADRSGFVPLSMPGMGHEQLYVHPYIAEEIHATFFGKKVGAMHQMYRTHLLGEWKKWATYRNPGFQFKHNIGRWFTNTIGGVTDKDYMLGRRIIMATTDKKWATEPIGEDVFRLLGFHNNPYMRGMEKSLTYGDLGELAASHGIGRANSYAIAFAHEGGNEAGTVEKTGAGRWTGDKIHAVDSKLKGLTATIDTYHRTAAWLTGLQHTQGDFYGARAFAMMRQGDFGDLTHAERGVADIMPFYKWMRTNLPYQFRMMAENPGAYVAMGVAQQSFFDARGYDWVKYQRSLPDYMRNALTLPVLPGKQDKTGGVAALTFDLPYADLHKGLRDYLSSALPLGRNLVESYGIEQSIFTGAPLGQKMVPLPGWLSIPGLREVIDATGLAKKGADGKTLYIPDTLDNVLQSVPLYTRYKDWLTAAPSRVDSRWGAFLRGLTAFNMQSQQDAGKNLTREEQAFYFDTIIPAIANMKSMGYTLPTSADLAWVGDQLVNKNQPTPGFPATNANGAFGTLSPSLFAA